MVTLNLAFYTILFVSTAIGWLLTGKQMRKTLLLILNQISLFMIFWISINPIFACVSLFVSILIIALPLYIFEGERQFPRVRKNNIALYIVASFGLILFIFLFVALINVIQAPSLTLETGDSGLVELSERVWIFLILFPLFFIQFYLLIRKIGNPNE